MVKYISACVVFVTACGSLQAQLANTTSLLGAVSDSGGAAMAGVLVTAKDGATGQTYNATTSAEGYYNIQFVKVGTYTVTASRDGFSTQVKNGVAVDLNHTVRADLVLAIGQVNQQIEVTASTPPLSTDEPSIKETLGQRAVADLPLNGRDVLQLAVTTPGVLPGQKGSNGVPPGEDFIGAGTREIQNSISLDGISIMNNLSSQTPYHPSVDAIQEFEVQTGTYSAQYGAYLGTHLNLLTKSGTNSVHGAVYEFFRNDALDARNYFESPADPKVPLRQNQFGFVLSGPVYIPKLYDGRNKTFFMANYEGLRQVQNNTGFDTVLTQQERSGNFSDLPAGTQLNGLPGNIIPPSQLSPQALKAIAYMPPANLPGTTNNLLSSFPNNTNYNQTIDRLDQNIGDKIRLFFRYALQDETIVSGTTNPFADTTIPAITHNWVFGYTQTITPNIVNDLRIGYQHEDTNALNYWYVHNLASAGTDLGIPGFDADTRFGDPGLPLMYINNYTTLGTDSTNWFQGDKTWQGTDSFTWTHGTHTVIAGADIRKLTTGRQAVNQPLGAFTFSGDFTGNGAADFLLGFPISDTTPTAEVKNVVAAWRDGFFVVDNWQVSKKLTLNLGLRYELPTVPYTVNGYATILNPEQTGLVPTNPPQPGFSFVNPNHKNFAPRTGFAYRTTDRTVIRGGFGIYYNPNQTNTFTFLSANPPFSNVSTYNSAPPDPTISLSNPTPASSVQPAGLANIISPNRSLPTAYMNQWSFDLQQGLWKNAALDISYLGSHSLHLDRSFYTNTPLPGPGNIQTRRPNQDFAVIRIIQNDEIANYNGLSIILRQRTNSGLTLLASYTWSHALDVSSDSNNGGFPQDPYNWRGDYGNSNWDVRHRFVSSFNYEIPFFKSSSNALLRQTLSGWQTNGIVTIQSGYPFTVNIPGDAANTGAANQRPDLLHQATANCGDSHLFNCIDLTAYAPPTPYTYGNAGRNALFGPGLTNIDFSLFKNFSILEKASLQFRAEAFNLSNTPGFSNPNSGLPDDVGGAYPAGSSFGSITSTSHDNREIQFALKLLF